MRTTTEWSARANGTRKIPPNPTCCSPTLNTLLNIVTTVRRPCCLFDCCIWHSVFRRSHSSYLSHMVYFNNLGIAIQPRIKNLPREVFFICGYLAMYDYVYVKTSIYRRQKVAYSGFCLDCYQESLQLLAGSVSAREDICNNDLRRNLKLLLTESVNSCEIACFRRKTRHSFY